MITYYYCEDGFIGVTDESPKGLRNLVFVGRGPRPGAGVESVCEQAYAINQLGKMKEVSAEDVPDDWFAAIGYEKRPAKCAPECASEDTPQEMTYVTIELPGDRLRKKMLAKPGTPEYIQWQAEKWQFWVTLALSFAVAWYLTFYVWKL